MELPPRGSWLYAILIKTALPFLTSAEYSHVIDTAMRRLARESAGDTVVSFDEAQAFDMLGLCAQSLLRKTLFSVLGVSFHR